LKLTHITQLFLHATSLQELITTTVSNVGTGVTGAATEEIKMLVERLELLKGAVKLFAPSLLPMIGFAGVLWLLHSAPGMFFFFFANTCGLWPISKKMFGFLDPQRVGQATATATASNEKAATAVSHANPTSGAGI
jgi:hypothetical protein